MRKAVVLPFVCLLAAGTMLGQRASAQRFERGQNIQPVYEGWERNADGSYNLLFGYLNRSYAEEAYVPVGPNNSFSPGEADQGQPTHYYPRRQYYVFKVRVPADWGNKELVWTVTHNGRTDRAVGWLAGFYEIDAAVASATRGGGLGLAEEDKGNKPPSIERVGAETLTTSVGTPVTLVAKVSDDGLPRRRAAPPPANPGPAPVVPQARQTGGERASAQDKVSASEARKTGLAVTWLHYRGPATLTFDPMVVHVESGGRASTQVQFSEAGTYVVRAVADDQMYTVPVNFTIQVQQAAER